MLKNLSSHRGKSSADTSPKVFFHGKRIFGITGSPDLGWRTRVIVATVRVRLGKDKDYFGLTSRFAGKLEL